MANVLKKIAIKIVKTCYEESKKNDEQYCIFCKYNDNYIDDKGNCYKKCLEGYFSVEEDKTCHKCYEKCKNCFSMGTNEEQNCLECLENSTYKFLLKGEFLLAIV